MTEESPTSKTPRIEPLSVLWRVLAAPWTLVLFLGLIVLVLVLATLIPQIPSQEVGDPRAWLAVQPGFFGQRNGLIRALGLYDVYHTFLFHLLLALTGLGLFVWVVESADLAWRASRGRWSLTSFVHWGGSAPQVCVRSSLSPTDIQARLCDFLAQRGYRWTELSAMSAPNLVTSRREILLWARPLAYGALVVALAGLGTMGIGGWQGEAWPLAPGQSQPVGHESPYAVRLDAFDLQLGDGVQLCASQSEVSWLEGETVVAEDTVSVGHPATLQGIALRQIDCVPAVKMDGQDKDGRALTFQAAGEEPSGPGMIEVVFPTPDAQQFVLIPSHDFVLALAFEPLSTQGQPSLYVSLLRNGGGERQHLATLHGSGSVSVDGLQIEIDVAYRPILRVDHRPGMGLVIGGMALAIIALAVAWIVPPRLAWIAVGQDEDASTLVQILALPGARGSRWLPRLASRLREVLADDA